MKYCEKCGAELLDEAVVCPKCGCAVESKKAEPAVPAKKPGTAGLVLGIVGAVLAGLSWVIFGFIFGLAALIVGIVGIVQSAKALKLSKNGKSITGLILSILATVNFVAAIVYLLLVVGSIFG